MNYMCGISLVHSTLSTLETLNPALRVWNLDLGMGCDVANNRAAEPEDTEFSRVSRGVNLLSPQCSLSLKTQQQTSWLGFILDSIFLTLEKVVGF